MRIGIDISLLCFKNPTGVGNYAAGIVEALIAQSPHDHFELCAIIPRKSLEEITKYSWTTASNVRLHILPIPQRFFSLFSQFFQSQKLLKIEDIFKIRCDVFHHFDWFIYPTQAPLTSTIYDVTAIREPQWHTQAHAKLFNTWFQLISNNASHLFPISLHTQCELININKKWKNKSTVIYPIIKERDMHFDATIWNHIKTEYSIENGYFLSVGTIEPRKNYSALCKAYQQFREKHKKIQLVIVGHEGWDQQSLKLLKKISGIKYLSYCESNVLAYLYHHALGFIYPSLSEGFGLPIYEAMSFDTVVACSNQASMPEVGGKAVIYIDPYQPETIEKAMNRITQLSIQDRKMFSIKSRKQTNKFSNDESVSRMYKVWQSLCERKNP